MKKLIILLTTLLSLNLFGGLLHPKLNTIVTLKGGMEFIVLGPASGSSKLAGTLEPSVEFKTYLLKHERLNIYFSGKLANEMQFNDRRRFANDMKIIASFGTERDYDVVKFYQQFGFGLGYYVDKAEDRSPVHYLSIPLEVEVGTNYKNYLISLTVGGSPLIGSVNSAIGDLTLKLGLGYEF